MKIEILPTTKEFLDQVYGSRGVVGFHEFQTKTAPFLIPCYSYSLRHLGIPPEEYEKGLWEFLELEQVK